MKKILFRALAIAAVATLAALSPRGASAQGYNQMHPAGTLAGTDSVAIYRGVGVPLTLAPLSSVWGSVPSLALGCAPYELMTGMGGGVPDCAQATLSVDTLGDLRALTPPTGVLGSTIIIHVAGAAAVGDGGGGNFDWSAASTCGDDGFSCIEPATAPSAGRWLRLLDPPNGVTETVAAAGTIQTNALALSCAAEVHIVSSVPAGAGVMLPQCGNLPRHDIVIDQDPANLLAVYPPAGGAIGALGTNASYPVGPLGSSVSFDYPGGSRNVWNPPGGVMLACAEPLLCQQGLGGIAVGFDPTAPFNLTDGAYISRGGADGNPALTVQQSVSGSGAIVDFDSYAGVVAKITGGGTFQTLVSGANQIILGGQGSAFGLIANPAANQWELGANTTTGAMPSSPALIWTSAGGVLMPNLPTTGTATGFVCDSSGGAFLDLPAPCGTVPWSDLTGAPSFGPYATATQGELPGTTTNDQASAGNVGELLSCSVAAASAVALTTATQTTICSLALTAGDWDISGYAVFSPATSTLATEFEASLSDSSGVIRANVTIPYGYCSLYLGSSGVSWTNGIYETCTLSPVRVSLAAGATWYLVEEGFFTSGSMGGWGIMRARRMR